MNLKILKFFSNPTTGIVNIIKDNTEITYLTILNVLEKKYTQTTYHKVLK